VASAVTRKPAGALGIAPLGQPSAGAMCTVGISALSGAAAAGLAPTPARSSGAAVSPQAASSKATGGQEQAIGLHANHHAGAAARL
jgi:hypothetical protein